ncbi:hypothetical protein AVEN_63133-1 [Araneus ventricosus]|uniref:Uncharacterized protein n=1 Tax=Araneus ventricosus TaxID=182803 RepID=A0A4Y2NTJ2_ARAVE|nr:hypothetical protein AVEN_63133-1 [Araneus ventricosus]
MARWLRKFLRRAIRCLCCVSKASDYCENIYVGEDMVYFPYPQPSDLNEKLELELAAIYKAYQSPEIESISSEIASISSSEYYTCPEEISNSS